MAKKKTKLSGLVDNSSFGMSIAGQTEMEISAATMHKLRKMMEASPLFTRLSGDPDNIKGTCKYQLDIPDSPVIYEFKKQGNFFLNTVGNPTKLMAGSNDIPVVLKDGEYEGNAVLNTFMYANRIMYALLDYIPGSDFKWGGKEKKRLIAGDININRFQFAFYSGYLDDMRDRTMRFSRLCLAGINATKEKVTNLAADLGLNVQAWDNHHGNMTIGSKIGDKKEFSITLYAKDEEPQYSGDNERRLRSLIRYDCTFNDYFLNAHGMKTIAGLEDKYKEICERDGYDQGFVKWLSDYIFNKLQMEYLIGLTMPKYEAMIASIESIVEDKKMKNEVILLRHWLAYGENFDTIAKKCEELGINPKKYAVYAANIRKQTGLILSITRRFHEGMLQQRCYGTMSNEERYEHMTVLTESNRRLREAELQQRDAEESELILGLMTKNGSLRLRKLTATNLKVANFWVYKQLNQMAGAERGKEEE